jgi:hypothetical protein
MIYWYRQSRRWFGRVVYRRLGRTLCRRRPKMCGRNSQVYAKIFSGHFIQTDLSFQAKLLASTRSLLEYLSFFLLCHTSKCCHAACIRVEDTASATLKSAYAQLLWSSPTTLQLRHSIILLPLRGRKLRLVDPDCRGDYITTYIDEPGACLTLSIPINNDNNTTSTGLRIAPAQSYFI